MSVMHSVEVPGTALYDAFLKGKADGRIEVDTIRFNEFQRGWHAALDFINEDTLKRVEGGRT